MASERDSDPLSGWERDRRAKWVKGLEATPTQRLEWLEEAIALAHAVGALPRPRPESARRNPVESRRR